MAYINIKRNDILSNKHINYNGFKINDTLLSLLFKNYKEIESQENKMINRNNEKDGKKS